MNFDSLLLDTFSALGLGLLASVLAEFLQRSARRRHRRVQGDGPTLQDRVGSLTNSLKESVGLLAEIQTEIAKRHELAAKLETDVKKYDELSKIKHDQAEALMTEMRGLMQEEGRKSFWKGAALNLIFFLLGFAVSYLTRLAAQP